MKINGFWTKPEVAIVLGIGVIIFTVLQAGHTAVIRNQRLDMTRRDLLSIVEASLLYYDEYGAWPTTYMGEVGDFRYGREFDNHLMMNVLRNVEGPGNHKHLLNPNRIVFLNVDRSFPGFSGINREGDFVDPWGNQYQVVVDTDLNMSCDISRSIYGHRDSAGVVAWSTGPDGISDTYDDVTSWDVELRTSNIEH